MRRQAAVGANQHSTKMTKVAMLMRTARRPTGRSLLTRVRRWDLRLVRDMVEMAEVLECVMGDSDDDGA